MSRRTDPRARWRCAPRGRDGNHVDRPEGRVAGAYTWICVGVSLTRSVAGVLPKKIWETLLRLVPVMVTRVPPLAVPVFGVTEVITGA